MNLSILTRPNLRGKTRIYFHLEGETLQENMINRTTRPYTEYRKLLPQVYEMAGINPDAKARWSKHAGCTMCPCSPGFILGYTLGIDIHVTVTDVPATTGGPDRDIRAMMFGDE